MAGRSSLQIAISPDRFEGESKGVLGEEGKCISKYKAAWKSVHKGWESVKVARNGARGGLALSIACLTRATSKKQGNRSLAMNADPLSFSSFANERSLPFKGSFCTVGTCSISDSDSAKRKMFTQERELEISLIFFVHSRYRILNTINEIIAFSRQVASFFLSKKT